MKIKVLQLYTLLDEPTQFMEASKIQFVVPWHLGSVIANMTDMIVVNCDAL